MVAHFSQIDMQTGMTFLLLANMKEKNYTGIIPEQQTGKAIDSETSLELDNVEEAKAFFNVVKTRLQDINNWHELAGSFSADFQLVNRDGLEVQRRAEKGDFFKIDIPGPGTESGDGYDWVQIEKIESTATPEVESYGLRVRPAKNPQNSREDIAHFYSSESTSSFTVTRESNKLRQLFMTVIQRQIKMLRQLLIKFVMRLSVPQVYLAFQKFNGRHLLMVW